MCACVRDNAFDGYSASRRQFLGLTAGGIGAAALGRFALPGAASASAEASRSSGTTVVLLGTGGGPIPWWGRHGIASVVSVNGTVYAVDCGLGMSQRMVQSGLKMAQLSTLLITHLHSDHFVDYLNLLQMTETPASVGSIGHAIDVYGPDHPTPGATQPGDRTRSLRDVTDALLSADAYEFNTRPGDPSVNVHLLDPGVTPTPSNVAPPMAPFTVMEDDNVRVSAILVKHAPIPPSYAFRFDTDDGSVVFSGDTAPTENLVRLAAGADVLVHEAFDRDWLLRTEPSLVVPFDATHTRSTDVGVIAHQAGAPLLLLNHLVPGDPRMVSDAQWRNAAKTGYDGRVVVGHDLTTVRLRRGRAAAVWPGSAAFAGARR